MERLTKMVVVDVVSGGGRVGVIVQSRETMRRMMNRANK